MWPLFFHLDCYSLILALANRTILFFHYVAKNVIYSLFVTTRMEIRLDVLLNRQIHPNEASPLARQVVR